MPVCHGVFTGGQDEASVHASEKYLAVLVTTGEIIESGIAYEKRLDEGLVISYAGQRATFKIIHNPTRGKVIKTAGSQPLVGIAQPIHVG